VNNYRIAREFCFQYFFHLQLPVFEVLKGELKKDHKIENFRHNLNDFKASTNTLLSDEGNLYVEKQITETIKNYDEIETIISAHLKNWKISRLSKVDHTNLLLSVNELCFTKNAPMKVVINEAIEIAKKFGTQDSSSFVNGVLDSIANKES